ncbi:MAG: tetratricopeptide repeat protein, partial [Rhodospirillales bacterium]|nr:tetratricopeptide repeat protein [Rhodospirillales bacterium]
MTKSVESLFKTAQALERLHDWSGAEDAYRQAAEANPNLLEAHHNRATVLRRLDRADEALVEAARAAQLAPDHPTVRF